VDVGALGLHLQVETVHRGFAAERGESSTGTPKTRRARPDDARRRRPEDELEYPMTDLTLPRELSVDPSGEPTPTPGRGGIMAAIGHFVVRRARLVLIVALLAFIGFGVLGAGAFGKLKTGGFQDPAADSTAAQALTDRHFGGAWDVVLLVHAKAGTVDDAPARAAGRAAARRLAATPDVSNVVSYWSTRSPGLRSKDGQYALVLANTPSDHELSASELAALQGSAA